MTKSEIYRELDRLLTAEGMEYDKDEERGIFHFDVSGHGRIKKLKYIIAVSDSSYRVFAFGDGASADKDDKAALLKMAEYLTRANYGMMYGNFEMDFKDGEVRYRTFVDCEDITLEREVFRNSIVVPAHMFECYGDGIMQMIYTDKSPEEAISEAEDN